MINTGLPLQQKQHVINWFSQDMGILLGMQTNAITLITIHLLSKTRGSGGLEQLRHENVDLYALSTTPRAITRHVCVECQIRQRGTQI